MNIFAKNNFKTQIMLIIIFLGGFILRLAISHLGFHDDLISITGWAEWIYKNGAKGLYANNVWTYSWPTQLPLVNLLYGFNIYLYDILESLLSATGYFIAMHHLGAGHIPWFFDFVKWFGSGLFYADTPFKTGHLVTIKLAGILADLGIALIIFKVAKRKNINRALLLSSIYLLAPFSWYISALWGQYDQLSTLFLLCSFLLLFKKRLILSPLILFISLQLKPTSLIFIPLFVWIYWKNKPSTRQIIISCVLLALIFIYLVTLFTDKNIFVFLYKDFIPRIFLKSEFRVSTNSFNFWHILIGNNALNSNTPFLLIPAQIWGWIIFLVFNIYAVKITKVLKLENIFIAIFLVGAGGWLFLTNMLDRYFFAGVVALLFVSIYKKNLLKYWLILSLIFWLNLYNQWWFPSNLDLLHQVLAWQDGLLTRLFSLVNVIVFLRVVQLILLSSKNGTKQAYLS